MGPELSRQFVVVLGPAGSGKTTLVSSFGKWVEKTQSMKVGYVNLDPGAEELSFTPDFDVRRLVRVRDVMHEYGLGPNGAFVKSADLMVEHLGEIMDGISQIDAEYVLVDTPGQMELFVFRDSGPEIVAGLKRLGFPVAVVVFDPSLARRATDIVALKLLTTVVQLRLDVESIPVLNKADLPGADRVAKVLEEPDALNAALSSEKGVTADLAQSLAQVIEEYRQAARLVRVSALKGKGFEELYDVLHEVYCTCGDLT